MHRRISSPLSNASQASPWVAAVASLLGCTVAPNSGSFGSGASNATGGPSAGETTTAASSGVTPADGSGSSAAPETGNDTLRLDVGAGDEAPQPDMGCTAVDILFVVDNSGSMCPDQATLSRTLPDFADALFNALPPDTSLHVGITTSSFTTGGTHSEANCMSEQGAAEIDAAYTPPTEMEVPGNGFQGRLLEYDGLRYFEADTGDPSTRLPLMEWFANATFSVGCNGGAFEFPSAAAAYALNPVNAATNAGFLRDQGAVLAIFFLTDEVDQSPEGLETYRDMVLAAKAGCGGDECISAAGLLNAACVPSDPFVFQFLSAFGEPPTWGDIADDAAFVSTVRDSLTQVIEQTCQLVPAG